MKISAPCHLEAHHHLESFCCGEPLLDTWLKTRARKNEASGASRTYVITRSNDVVVLLAGSGERQPRARAGKNPS